MTTRVDRPRLPAQLATSDGNWHEQLRLGALIHWGPYSILGGEWPGKTRYRYAEHIMRTAGLTKDEYLRQVVRHFAAEQYKPDEWCRLLGDAGFKYIIITAKHHDGFAMYPSAVSEWNIRLSQFRGDPIGELNIAARRHGLRFGIYYSHAVDWEHPQAPGNDWERDNPGGYRELGGREWWRNDKKAFAAEAHDYVDQKAIPQILELLRMYSPDLLWLDTPGKLPPEENIGIMKAIRAAAPHVLVNGRLWRDGGDYINSENHLCHSRPFPRRWEGVVTTHDSFGWVRHDGRHKPASHFIRLLAASVARNGNLLVNFGPNGDGRIDYHDAEICREMGRWLSRNGASIYHAGPAPLAPQTWGTCTKVGNRLYLHITMWPSGKPLTVDGLRTIPARATLWAQKQVLELALDQCLGGVRLMVPTTPPDPHCSVIELYFDGPIDACCRVHVYASAAKTLHVFDGDLFGESIRFHTGARNQDVLRGWAIPGTGVRWQLICPIEGCFKIVIDYAAAPEHGGVLAIDLAGARFTTEVYPTGSDSRFASISVGETTIAAGECDIQISAYSVVGTELMRLRSLTLVPVATAKGEPSESHSSPPVAET